MKRVEIVPEGFPCSLEECPPGIFCSLDMKNFGFKTEYGKSNGDPEVYCLGSGETWCTKAKVISCRTETTEDE